MASVFAVEAPHAVDVSSPVAATIFRFESASANHWWVRVPPAVVPLTKVMLLTTKPPGSEIGVAHAVPEAGAVAFTTHDGPNFLGKFESVKPVGQCWFCM